jgi:hypothetical protein
LADHDVEGGAGGVEEEGRRFRRFSFPREQVTRRLSGAKGVDGAGGVAGTYDLWWRAVGKDAERAGDGQSATIELRGEGDGVRADSERGGEAAGSQPDLGERCVLQPAR